MSTMGSVERPDGRWYPDLVAAGDLSEALRRAIRGLDADGGVEVHGSRATSAVLDGVAPQRGSFLVLAAAGARRFDVSCWFHSVILMDGATDDLTLVAGAALAWRAGVSCAEIERRYPFLSADEIADAHDHGSQDPLSVQWRLKRRHWAQVGRFPETVALLEIAFHVPELRRLYPYTSHADVHFSTGPDVLTGRHLPHVRVRHGERYYVCGPAPDLAVLGETRSAAEALSMVLRHLPVGNTAER